MIDYRYDIPSVNKGQSGFPGPSAPPAAFSSLPSGKEGCVVSLPADGRRLKRRFTELPHRKPTLQQLRAIGSYAPSNPRKTPQDRTGVKKWGWGSPCLLRRRTKARLAPAEDENASSACFSPRPALFPLSTEGNIHCEKKDCQKSRTVVSIRLTSSNNLHCYYFHKIYLVKQLFVYSNNNTTANFDQYISPPICFPQQKRQAFFLGKHMIHGFPWFSQAPRSFGAPPDFRGLFYNGDGFSLALRESEWESKALVCLYGNLLS